MLSSMLNLDQLQVAVAAAKRQFDRICGKYPELKVRLMTGEPASFLVMSLPGGQIGIDSSPTEILSKFPAMVVDDSTKVSALNLLVRMSGVTKDAEMERLEKQLDQLISKLKYDEKCRVEIRFNDLNYDLVWKLQVDDLVDRSLTLQTKASIRIVLGTLAQFERTIPPSTRRKQRSSRASHVKCHDPRAFFQNPVAASRQSAAFFARTQKVGGALPRRRYAG